jgi:glucose-6-phosphate isomerase
MHTIVDRIVVLGEESDAGARTLMQGCCQPYWNELSRGARGSKPRIYFAGNPTDNDAIQGLLHLLGVNEGRLASCETDRWGLVVIGKSGETLETATAFPQFLAALKRSCGGDEAKVSELLVPVTGKDGKLLAMAAELGCPETFAIPDDVGGPYSVLSAAGLVPAAMLGINVIELLQGALAMNDHFAKKPAEENIILQFVAVHHLLERQCGIDIRVMSLWSNALESVGSWYDQLSALSLGENETGFTSVSTVHSRDLHARLQKHRLGKRDKVVNHILVDGYRFDDLPIGHRTSEHDPHNAIGDITLPQIMRMEVQATNEALSSHGCPSTSLFLPRVDELHLGQLLQMLMITSSVEVRLREVNPHG